MISHSYSPSILYCRVVTTVGCGCGVLLWIHSRIAPWRCECMCLLLCIEVHGVDGLGWLASEWAATPPRCMHTPCTVRRVGPTAALGHSLSVTLAVPACMYDCMYHLHVDTQRRARAAAMDCLWVARVMHVLRVRRCTVVCTPPPAAAYLHALALCGYANSPGAPGGGSMGVPLTLLFGQKSVFFV